MEFNYGLEKKKFDAEWERLRKEYREAGMSDAAIEEMYEFDLNAFRRRRTDARHEQKYDGFITPWGDEATDDENPLLLKFFSALAYEDSYLEHENRFGWINAFTNEDLYKKVNQLPDDYKELLTLIIIDGYSQQEIATKFNVNKSVISRKIARIKKLLLQVNF